MENFDTVKRCSKCELVRSVEEFSKDNRSKDGLQSHCKTCNRKYRQTNSSAIAKRKIEYRLANIDRITKQKAEYYQASKDQFFEQRAEYRRANADHIAEYKAKYYRTNRDRILAQMAEYYKTSAGRRHQYYQDNKDQMAKYLVEYRKTPQGKAACARSSAKRRAALDRTECTLTASEWDKILKLYCGLCAYCGIEPGKTQDHVIPLIPRPGEPQGTHTQDNVVPACTPCNSSKYNTPIEIWLPGWSPQTIGTEMRIYGH